MSRRKSRIRKAVLFCSIPVIVLTAIVFWARSSNEAPYVAGQETEGITRTLDREDDLTDCPFRFTDVTEESGIDFLHFPFRRTSQLPEDMGSGVAWADFDGDGNSDLFLVNIAGPIGTPAEELAASKATDRLYRNLGGGKFEDVTEAAGVGAVHIGNGASWGDYDADGDPDLIVTSWGQNILWENNGDGTFTDVTAKAGISGHGFWTGASWADFDLDGDLDLYICGYVEYEREDLETTKINEGNSDFPFTLNPSSWPPHSNRLYVNQGDGTFAERAQAAGVQADVGKSLGAVWADFDSDDYPDLYVANDVSDNVMYRNRGDGTFEDWSYEAVVADYRGAMGLAVADWDGDLDLDLFITHWIAQENALYSNLLTDLSDMEGESMMMFRDEADRFGLGQIALDLIGWGTSFADLDNDGRPDLFVANGSTFQDRSDPSRLLPMHPHLYWNKGREDGFFEVGEEAGMRTDPPGVGRGAAFCDYDLDGDLDLLICRHGGRARLLRNDSNGGNWVSYRLRAKTGHPSGLGARITAHAGEKALLRVAGLGPSYLSQDASDVLIGLGQATKIDSLEIVWPGGGRDLWRDLDVNGASLLEEGKEPQHPWKRISSVDRNDDCERSAEEIRRFWSLKREADAFLREQLWADAAAIYAELLEINPDHEDALYSQGNCLYELGKFSDAKESWEELLRVNSASSRAWIQIGLVHSTQDADGLFDLPAASAAFRRAHEINPEESGPLILEGEALLAAGDWIAADKVLAAAFGMNDRATSAFLLSGFLAWKNGDETRARDLLQRAVQSGQKMEPVRGVLGEGDAGTTGMQRIQRRATRRGLFVDCMESVLEVGETIDPALAFGWVEERLAELSARSS